MFYQPGTLTVSETVTHECNAQRAVGYYVEALLCVAPFMKTPLRALLTGVTNSQHDPSVSRAQLAKLWFRRKSCARVEPLNVFVLQIDLIRMSTLPVLRRFLGTDEGLELKVSKPPTLACRIRCDVGDTGRSVEQPSS